MSPHAAMPGTAPQGSPAAARRWDEAAAGRTRPRIAIVEDDWLIAVHIELDLEAAGFIVCGIAADCDAAVAVVDKERPDLVLMDIRLRGPVDGIDTARILVERFGVAVIFATAHTDRATVARAAGVRPAGWLAKPFSSAQLVGLVRSVLGRAS